MSENGNHNFRISRLEQDFMTFKGEFYDRIEKMGDRAAETSNKVTALLMMNGLITSILLFLLYNKLTTK